jgi:glycosyltransferase involved in cell wall biosynthesis
MKIGYVTRYDAKDINYWSGIGTYISKSLENQGAALNYLGPLTEKNKLYFQFKQGYYKYLRGQKHLRDYEPHILQDFGAQIQEKLKNDRQDIVFSATASPVAYLNCTQPIVFWGDAVFASLIDYYPFFSNLSQESIDEGNATERQALERCRLAIYSSDWAAKAAIRHYGVDKEKVKVVPFGANITIERTLDDVRQFANLRPSNKCKLLFLGVEWERKGGNVAAEVAGRLNRAGLKTELTVAGCAPDLTEEEKQFVKVIGFVDKATQAGREQINRLFRESHFLIVPSRAECYGIVFCEASSFGVPCISTNVGGIPTAVRNDINGQVFELDADIERYCDYISDLFVDYQRYKKLSLSAFNEYRKRLNWDVAGKEVKKLLQDCL